jgi:hypothetical protein
LTLSAAFLAGSMKNLGEVFPDRLTHFRRFDFHFAFIHGTIIPHQAKAFSATLASVTRIRAPRSIGF